MNKILDLDQKVLNFFMRPTDKSKVFDSIVVALAQYLVYLVPVSLVVYWFWPNMDNLRKIQERKNLLSGFLSGILGWVGICMPLTHVFHRARPDLALLGHQEVLFHRPTYSFPSDHASMIFALTFYFYFSGEHKKGHVYLVFAILISLSRISTGVHFPLDILGGIIVGLIAATIVKLLDRYLDVVWTKLIVLLKKIKLA